MQTMTAAEPLIAAQAQRISDLVVSYRQLAATLFDTILHVKSIRHSLVLTKEQTTAVSARLDQAISRTIEGTQQRTSDLFLSFGLFLYSFVFLDLLAIAYLIFRIIRSDFQIPMEAFIAGFFSYGEGHFAHKIDLGRQDEWADLELAFNMMVEEVSHSYQAVQESEQRLKYAQSVAALGNWVFFNPTGRLIWSDGVYDVLGIPDRQVSPGFDRLLELIHPDDKVFVAREHARIPAGFALKTIEFRILRREPGEERWLQEKWVYQFDNNQEIIRTDGILQDISDRKFLENNLKMAREEADRANDAKSTFLAHMSHEIRTPLNGIIATMDLIDTTQLAPDQIELVDTVKTSSLFLLDIINDVLDFSKISTGNIEIHLSPFKLADILGKITRSFSQQMADAGLTFSVSMAPDLPANYRGDSLRLGQILINFISNALKFTREGSIRLLVSAVPKGINNVDITFSVIDTGVGVPEEAKTRIFQSFRQADSAVTKSFGGTGLGLAICKGLVEKMGGHIGLESEQNVGSTFWFTVPIEVISEDRLPDGQQAPTTEPGKDPQRYPIKVLVVDDHPFNRLVAKGALSHYGCSVMIVDGGKAALDLCRQERFDLIIMDCWMPDVDGMATTRRLRQLEGEARTDPVPVIAVTADAMSGVHDSCLAAGMNDVLTKPFSLDQIGDLLAKWAPKQG